MGVERRREGTKLENRDPLPSVSEELLGSHWRQQHPGLQGWHLASSQPGRVALQGQLLIRRMVGGGVISALPGTAGWCWTVKEEWPGRTTGRAGTSPWQGLATHQATTSHCPRLPQRTLTPDPAAPQLQLSLYPPSPSFLMEPDTIPTGKASMSTTTTIMGTAWLTKVPFTTRTSLLSHCKRSDQAGSRSRPQSPHGTNLGLRLPWRHSPSFPLHGPGPQCSGLSGNSASPFIFYSSPWSALDLFSLRLKCFNRPFRFRASISRQIFKQGAPSSPHPPAVPASGPHDDEAGWPMGVAHTGLSSGAELRCYQSWCPQPCHATKSQGQKSHIPPMSCPPRPHLGPLSHQLWAPAGSSILRVMQEEGIDPAVLRVPLTLRRFT